MGTLIQFPDRFKTVEPLLVDHNGREMQLYTLSYLFAGRRWSFEIWAYSFADIEDRIAAMRKHLRLDGVIVGEIPGR